MRPRLIINIHPSTYAHSSILKQWKMQHVQYLSKLLQVQWHQCSKESRCRVSTSQDTRQHLCSTKPATCYFMVRSSTWVTVDAGGAHA